MKVHRYSEQQRRQWVYDMQHKLKTVKHICTEAVISRATLYNWVKEFAEKDKQAATAATAASLPPTDALAWQPLDRHKMLLAALGKIDQDKKISRRLVSELMKRYTLTAAQACQLAGIDEAAYQYKPRKPEVADRLVYDELLQLIAEDPLRSLDDCHAILQNTQPAWTRKQVKRVYRQGRLYLRRTRVRNTRLLHAPAMPAQLPAVPLRIHRPGAFWQAGAVAVQLTNQQSHYILYVIDFSDGTPLNACVEAGEPTTAAFIHFLALASRENGAPKKMRVPALPPFNGREVAQWIWTNKVALYQLSMAKPENILETGHLQDSLRHQLAAGCTTPDELAANVAAWLHRFAAAAALPAAAIQD